MRLRRHAEVGDLGVVVRICELARHGGPVRVISHSLCDGNRTYFAPINDSGPCPSPVSNSGSLGHSADHRSGPEPMVEAAGCCPPRLAIFQSRPMGPKPL